MDAALDVERADAIAAKDARAVVRLTVALGDAPTLCCALLSGTSQARVPSPWFWGALAEVSASATT